MIFIPYNEIFHIFDQIFTGNGDFMYVRYSDEFEYWIEENKILIEEIKRHCFGFGFEFEEDAMAFKLRWI